MNAPTLRGLAVLALLCLLPRASAVDVVYSNSFFVFGTQTGGSLPQTGKTIEFSQYSPSLDPLTSVTIEIRVSMIVSGFTNNPLGVPMAFFSSIYGRSSFYAIDVPNLSIFYSSPTQQTSAPGPIVTLQPDERFGNSAAFEHILSKTFSDPSDIAHFVGSGVDRFVINVSGDAPSQWGSASVSANVTATLTYHTPDGGSSLPMLCISSVTMVLLGAFHRRKVRRPGRYAGNEVAPLVTRS